VSIQGGHHRSMARITLAQPAVILAHDHLAMGGMTSSHCPHRRQGVTLPDPPPYQSDGVKLSIQNLEAELEKVSPKMDFGKAKTRRGTEVVDETEFDAPTWIILMGLFCNTSPGE